MPARGKLAVDTTAARIKIDRERAALTALLYASAELVRPELRDLIVHPGRASAPVDVQIGPDDWIQRDLDLDKQAAVKAALGAPDLFLVKGPPGTGKTTFIAELVVQELRRNPRAIVLISSQTNVALDNALVRINGFPLDARLIRLADAQGSRVSADAEQFLLDRQMAEWRDLVRLRSQAFLEEWCKGYGLEQSTVSLALQLHWPICAGQKQP